MFANEYRTVTKGLFVLLISVVLFCVGSSISEATPIVPGSFSTTWKTDNPGTTAANQIRIPTTGTGYNYNIYWENVASSTMNGTLSGRTGATTITFPVAGTYRVDITGSFPRIYFNESGDNQKILTVEQWGAITWASMVRAFMGALNLQVPATDAPNLTSATSTASMFASNFSSMTLNSDISHWDMSTIQDMSYMFGSNSQFNQDLSSWNVSSATNMSGMFAQNTAFNQDLSNWNVSNVQNFDSMFFGASQFNQSLGSWSISPTASIHAIFSGSAFNQDFTSWTWLNNPARTSWAGLLMGAEAFTQDISNLTLPSNITDISELFRNNSTFNQDISNWDVSHVTEMYSVFSGATTFNQPLNSWNVSNVTGMANMFDSMDTFNQPLDQWNVSNVTDMGCMFCFNTAFNQPLNNWDVSKVTDMNNLFWGATTFNQPLNNWDVSSVTEMSYIFEDATAFDQDLSNWDVSDVIQMYNVFRNSGLSTSNYSNILSSWSQQTVQNGLDLTDIGPNGTLTPYCSTVQSARDILTGAYSWTINDGGSVLCFIITYDPGLNASISGSASQQIESGEDGSSVEVIPNSGYRFVAWSDGRTDNPRVDTGVASSTTFTAITELVPVDTPSNSSGSSATKVGERLQHIEQAIASSSQNVVATMDTFIDAINDLLGYLVSNENDLDTLTPEESVSLIRVLRDLLLFFLKMVPGV